MKPKPATKIRFQIHSKDPACRDWRATRANIPTHQGIFALPFLWPFSSYSLSGARWENAWFVAVNCGALLLLYSWIWLRKRSLHSTTTSTIQ